MEKITEYCTGCRACEQLCPKHSIKIMPDHEGFLIPVIDSQTCVNCGLCAKRCPQNQTKKMLSQAKLTIAARLKDDILLYKAASGGAFAGIATQAIKSGWIVFGVCYDECLVAHHNMAQTTGELEALLSSKYVQSDTKHTFSQVKELLVEGKKVVYSGTGCQIGGLRSYLGCDYDNLLTIDLICHGVPSPLLFNKYIDWLKSKHRVDKITEYDFRDKRDGWGLSYKYKYKSKYKYSNCTTDPYYMYFLNGDIYRECCYYCHYASTKRAGDITIADYWGIEKVHPTFSDTRGVSLILLNTDKGKLAWNKTSSLFETIISDIESAALYNGNLKSPTKRNDKVRDHVYDGINEMAGDKYISLKLPYTIPLKARIKSLIPMYVQVWIKKVLDL